jgi:hypothetical protein
MKLFFLFIFLVFPFLQTVHATDDNSPWSRADNGLRGRLAVVVPAKGNAPFFRIFVELQNVADVLGQVKINFSPTKMTFKITSKDGAVLAPDQGPYDGMIVGWVPIFLPFDGTIKFPIECQGLAVPPGTKAIIDLDSPRIWIIPQDGKTYFISASLTTPEDKSDHSAMIWHGTLNFPPAKIPNAK